jgi:hypothetical protein
VAPFLHFELVFFTATTLRPQSRQTCHPMTWMTCTSFCFRRLRPLRLIRRGWECGDPRIPSWRHSVTSFGMRFNRMRTGSPSAPAQFKRSHEPFEVRIVSLNLIPTSPQSPHLTHSHYLTFVQRTPLRLTHTAPSPVCFLTPRNSAPAPSRQHLAYLPTLPISISLREQLSDVRPRRFPQRSTQTLYLHLRVLPSMGLRLIPCVASLHLPGSYSHCLWIYFRSRSVLPSPSALPTKTPCER